MNLAHVHIVLNHIPSLGSLAALLLLVAAIYKKSDELRQLAYQVLVLISVATLPTYISGAAGRSLILDRADVSKGMIELHQNAAMLTLLAMTLTGALAWFALWEYRRFTRPGAVTSTGTLLATVLTAGLILYTGSLGGKISHPEIREAADAAVSEEVGWRLPIELAVSDYSWIWPAAETIHFIGMGLLFGISLLLVLRTLGGFKSIPFDGIHRLLPLGILGFVFNVLTGMLFFIASPGLYIEKAAFMVKIMSSVLGAAPILYFTMFDSAWQIKAGAEAPAVAKLAAVSALILLLSVMIFGRLLPFFY